MKRFILFTSLLSLLVLAPMATNAANDAQSLESSSSGPVSLRENIVVSGAYIRLGDLFSNTPADKAQTAIAYAPKPGRKASFDARWLFRLARAYKLEWRPLSADLRILVSRDSIVIDQTEIKDAISASLMDYNLPENTEIILSNKNLMLHVPSNIVPEVVVEDINYNERSQRFAAVVSVGEKNMNAVERIRVVGQVHKMLEVPTLSRNISKGEKITENDIAWIKMRADRTQRDVIVDAGDLIGMTPKRHLRADVPVRSNDIQPPTLVSKGSVVTIILKKPGMTLTSQGRAMENGADGETVRVVNTKTNRTIEAIVVGSSMVTVLTNQIKSAELAYNQ